MGSETTESRKKTGKFETVGSKVDFVELEHRVLELWEAENSFARLMERNRGGPRWSFIDGPVTANNPMGVHHAWGRTYKDLYQRLKAMQGYDQRFQNGFDCQGLWLEVETERELGFNTKADIEHYGLDKFSRACRARVDKFSNVWVQQSIRLGQWMDWENSYYTMSDGNITSIWHFLKTCHEKGWLYQGHHAMPWCARCGTSLSQHELADTYEEIQDRAVTLKFPLVDREGEALLVWTTTPWTLTSNVAAAVHPELEYRRVRHKGEILIVSSGALAGVFGDAEVEDLGAVKGGELMGLRYRGPFDDLPVVREVEHRVIPWEEVSEEEGTGIVHIAPGCGAEDFELGKEHGLARLEPLDGSGVYVDGFGWLTGKSVFDVETPIIEDLTRKGILFDDSRYSHRYPFCWRCGAKLVFRVEDEWFIWCDEIRPQMKEAARDVVWIPESVGKRTQDWYDNMGDWCISRKRYWGLPLPFFRCPRGHLTIVGSKEELRELALDPAAVDQLPELHRPWIDDIKIRCRGGPVRDETDRGRTLAEPAACGETAERIKDVGDCWLDAGIVAFSTLKYFEDRSYWERWFPAEVVIEMREQVRLWFYAMMFSAVTLEGRAPYKRVFAYEKIHDEKGEPMHKSKGNAIWFDDAAEKMGVDVMRWLYCAANPTQILRFGFGAADEVRRNLITLWNVYSFFVTYAGIDEFDPGAEGAVELEDASGNLLDRWILSAYYTLVKAAHDHLESYDVHGFMRLSQTFIDNLSTWYVRRSRRRFWKSASDDDKRQAHRTLYHVLLGYARLMAPIIPFVTEAMYRNLSLPLREGAADRRTAELLDPAGKAVPDSVHLTAYPVEAQQHIDETLNEQMEMVLDIVRLGRYTREKARVKVRQPMRRVRVLPREENGEALGGELERQIAEELNVKEVLWEQDGVETYAEPAVKLDFKALGAKYGSEMKRLNELVRRGSWKLEGQRLAVGDAPDFRLDPEEFTIEYSGRDGYLVAQDARFFVVLDLALDPELVREGWAREMVRRVQDLRKQAGYHVADRISLHWAPTGKPEEVERMMAEQGAYVSGETLSAELVAQKGVVDADATVDLGEGAGVWVGVKRGN
ncbi:MAG: isoleucine--tRNA ligase [Candidatus Eisenbacteria bacterium]|nr:isoleucine--tRNA ligase [Candidatus Eisenbacteria bacterium]